MAYAPSVPGVVGDTRVTDAMLCLRLPGYDKVSVYDGLWDEWSRRSALPASTGEN